MRRAPLPQETQFMSTLEITLPDPLREFVEAQVSAGRAPSASDFVRELVRDAQ